MFANSNLRTNAGPEMPPADSFRDKTRKVARLKDYAVANGIEIEAGIMAEINALFWALNISKDNPDGASPDDRDKLDAAIVKLSRLTYPATIDNIPAGQNGESRLAQFNTGLLRLSIAALIVAAAGLLVSVHEVPQTRGAPGDPLSATLWSIYDNPGLGNSLLAVSLGFLGSAVNILFNGRKITQSTAFGPNDAFENHARLVLGAVIGWVAYFALAQTAFADLVQLNGQGRPDGGRFLVMLPFVAGYGTTLVVGLLNKIVRATEVTIDLDDPRERGLPAAGKKK